MKKTVLRSALISLLIAGACIPCYAQNRILIAYFSRVGNTDFPAVTDTDTRASINVSKEGMEGNTEHVARMIQKATGGRLHLIKTLRTYPIVYRDLTEDARKEQKANDRPALAGEVLNMEEYDTVFIGFPNWWYDMPMALYTFLETYDLSGKTVVPFVTHGGSEFSDTRKAIASLQPEAKLMNGLSVYGKAAAGIRQQDIDDWVKELGL